MDNYYVVEMVRGDEFTEGIYDTLVEAIAEAKLTWEFMNEYDRCNTKIEVRQYTEDIEDENCDCFDYNTFTWWTWRDHMMEIGGNLSWCRPYATADDKIAFVINEGDCVGMVADGDKVDYQNSNVVRELAKRANTDYALYDEKIPSIDILRDASYEGDCRDCPFFDECELMDDEYIM